MGAWLTSNPIGVWLRKNVLFALLAAGWLAFVPAAWAIFPTWSRWWALWRILVLVTYVLAGVTVALAAIHQSQQVENLNDKAEKARDAEREAAGMNAMNLLLHHGRGEVLEPYRLELYLLDETDEKLHSVASSNESPTERTWMQGCGATGAAFRTGRYTLATGDQVWNPDFSLTPEEQAEFSDHHLAVVSALPVKNLAGRVVGVLSADGATDTGCFESDGPGLKAQIVLGAALGRFIIDLCGWASDN